MAGPGLAAPLQSEHAWVATGYDGALLDASLLSLLETLRYQDPASTLDVALAFHEDEVAFCLAEPKPVIPEPSTGDPTVDTLIGVLPLLGEPLSTFGLHESVMDALEPLVEPFGGRVDGACVFVPYDGLERLLNGPPIAGPLTTAYRGHTYLHDYYLTQRLDLTEPGACQPPTCRLVLSFDHQAAFRWDGLADVPLQPGRSRGFVEVATVDGPLPLPSETRLGGPFQDTPLGTHVLREFREPVGGAETMDLTPFAGRVVHLSLHLQVGLGQLRRDPFVASTLLCTPPLSNPLCGPGVNRWAVDNIRLTGVDDGGNDVPLPSAVGFFDTAGDPPSNTDWTRWYSLKTLRDVYDANRPVDHDCVREVLEGGGQPGALAGCLRTSLPALLTLGRGWEIVEVP